MSLNRDLIGKEYKAEEFEVTTDGIIKYTLGYNEDNPIFSYPQRTGGIIAPPLFAVTWNHLALGNVFFDPELNVNLLLLLHGEQDMYFHKPVRPGDKITTVPKIESIEDKGSGELLVIKLTSKNQNGELVTETYGGMFIREGGSGKKSEEKKDIFKKGKVIFKSYMDVKKYQPYIYAVGSGDHNPIHVDPNVAKMAGFNSVILQGLCTMAFAQKAIIDEYLDENPERLKRLRVRFSKPVLPNERVLTKAWEIEKSDNKTTLGFEVYNQDCEKVISNGVAEVI